VDCIAAWPATLDMCLPWYCHSPQHHVPDVRAQLIKADTQRDMNVA
jgi:hypothetical protein